MKKIFISLLCLCLATIITIENAQSKQCYDNVKTSSITKNYAGTLRTIDYLQSQYWNIVKRNGYFELNTHGCYCEEENNSLIKDRRDLEKLFSTATAYVLRNSYLKKLYAIDYQYRNKNMPHRYEYADNYSKSVDVLLNEVYQQIRKTIPTKDFEALKLSEIKYLKDIDLYNKDICSQNGWEAKQEICSLELLYSVRRFRTILLLQYLQ